MKKISKHPKLFRKIANTLKKLITNKIKLIRKKKANSAANGKYSKNVGSKFKNLIL